MGKENESKMEIDERLVELIEEKKFGIVSCEDGFIELERYTPSGEDWIIDLYFDGTTKDFWKKVDECYKDFDIEEDVALWLPGAGKNGVPDARGLVENAEWKVEQLKLLCEAVHDLFIAPVVETELGEINMAWLNKAILKANGVQPDYGLQLGSWKTLEIAGMRAFVSVIIDEEDKAECFRGCWERISEIGWHELTPEQRAEVLAVEETSHFKTILEYVYGDFCSMMEMGFAAASRDLPFMKEAAK